MGALNDDIIPNENIAHINIRAPTRGAPTAAAAVLGEIIGAFKSVSTNKITGYNTDFIR